MGCGTSAPAAAVTLDGASHDRITILLAGPQGAGKSSFVRRFTEKRFVLDGGPKVTGERTITVNSKPVIVTLVNYAHAKHVDMSTVDGIMYLVRGDINMPFDGIYKYIDKLCNPARAFYRSSRMIGMSIDGATAHETTLAEFENGLLDTASRRSSGSADSTPAKRSKVTPTAVSVSPLASASRFGSSTLSVSTAGGFGGSAKSSQFSRGVPRFMGLRLDTGADPSMAEAIATPPLAVVVSQCDTLDDLADSNPRALVRLRAMASNWASANRCRVTFVSSKTGVGVNSSLAYLIKQIYLQRRKNSAAAAASPARPS